MVAAVEQGHERERRVPQPAVPIVPVPYAADVFGQGGRRRRHDPAGRLERHRLEGDERPDDGVPPRAVVGAPPGPVGPELRRLRQHVLGVVHLRRRLVGVVPGQGERDAFARFGRELGDRLEVLAAV